MVWEFGPNFLCSQRHVIMWLKTYFKVARRTVDESEYIGIFFLVLNSIIVMFNVLAPNGLIAEQTFVTEGEREERGN